MTIVQQVAALRKQEGVPGTLVARLAGTAPSNVYAIERGRRDPAASTLERIAGAAGVRLLAFPAEGAAFVSETAEILRSRAAAGDAAGAYRQLIQISDDLARLSPSTASLISYLEPAPVSPGWDAAIAGVVEWRLTQKGAAVPGWALARDHALDDPWEPLPAVYDIAPDDVPEPLRRRNVWIEQGEMESA